MALSAPLSVVPWINSRRCSATSSATNVDMMLLLLLLLFCQASRKTLGRQLQRHAVARIGVKGPL